MTDEERQENSERYYAKRLYTALVQLNKDMHEGAKVIDIGSLAAFDIKTCIAEMKAFGYQGDKPPQQLEFMEDM